jgi:2-dehydro-3-deoxygluconokinase
MRVVTFGEIMMRLEPEGFGRIAQALPGNVRASFAGAEANVAVAIAMLGGEASFVTALPENLISDALERELGGLGVDTSWIRRVDAGRLGMFFTERGANQRPSQVVYDREGSAIATLEPQRYDWERALDGADWFHVTGITPAISERAARATQIAVETAAKRGITVSCDLNFRGKLWRWDGANDPRSLARRVMPEILRHVSLVVGNEQDASDVLGIEPEESDVERGTLSLEGYAKVARAVRDRFDSVGSVAFTLRESVSASHNRWGAMLLPQHTDDALAAPLAGGDYVPYEVTHIVDRVGAGDAFASSLIWALNSPDYSDPRRALEFAVAFSCLAHSIEGDFAYVTREDAGRLLTSGGSGRVVR